MLLPGGQRHTDARQALHERHLLEAAQVLALAG